MKVSTILFLLGFVFLKSFSQATKTPSALHLFFQKNADSTIFYNYQPSFAEPPKILIISKKRDTVSIYKYGSAYSNNRFNILPKAIKDTLNKLHNYKEYLESYKLGVNKFFDTQYISQKTAHIFWTLLAKQSPWQIKDDAYYGGLGCTVAERKMAKPKNEFTDGGGMALDLITKNEIKWLYFDNPWYFESKDGCPGREGRKLALKIEKLFKIYFNN
jgi:hypothetical protein